MANFIIDTLKKDNVFHRDYLISVKALEKTNNLTRFVNYSLSQIFC